MDLQTTIDIGTLASVALAAAGLAFGVRVYKCQMNAQLFLEYTRRYEAILDQLPLEARMARLRIDGEPPDGSPELTTVALKYLNLCSKEFYLCERGYLSRDIWNIWEDEMRRTVRSPLFRRERAMLRNEFGSATSFSAA